MSDLLATVEVETGSDIAASVIWLHGLGASGHDFESIVPMLKTPNVRYVFPHAPSIPVTINGGMVMPAWYDITNADLAQRNDVEGIQRSAEQTRALIEREEERGIPAEKIVLAGFSQGGAIALYEGLRHPKKLAGIMALSTYLVLHEHLETERAEVNASTPILINHGEHDPMVPILGGQHAQHTLESLGYDVTFKSYPMEHQVVLEQIDDIGVWLNHVLQTQP
ncbi:MAG: carboxylesterase [Candidatus Eisenbacteria bacterium]|uniref:Carboxylesterase n=1 Tax=Eiseniibacteriota bacterium TaxID=2212470 RepID=A0A7Y2EBF6_UNCEI|nr:carboxylesterase [Candidatus Eisenbacteria bacterium]